MANPVSELQKPNPSNIVELFQLELNTTMHSISQTYYFRVNQGLDGFDDYLCHTLDNNGTSLITNFDNYH